MPTATADEVFERLRTDFPFYAANCLKIVTKQGKLVPFQLNRAQIALDRKLEERRAAGQPQLVITLKARQVGMCLSPDTRVLTADLEWKRIDDMLPGDEIVATDEMPPGGRGAGRKMRRAVVEVKAEVRAKAFRLTMDNGETLIATGPHRFLCRQRGAKTTQWRTVETMRVGDRIRHITKPWDGPGYEDGWMGGFIDGEGCLSKASRAGVSLTISQRLGDAYDRAESYLRERGFSYREELDMRSKSDSSKLGDYPIGKLVLSRMDEVFRVLGQTRPVRLRQGWWENKDLPGKKSGVAWSRVVSIVPLGVRRMVDLQTSSKTFIAEGFVSHNSTYAQGKLIHRTTLNPYHQAIVVAHDLETGAKLYRMGETMYSHLPDEPDLPLKPTIGSHKRARQLIFSERAADAWQQGSTGLNSEYLVSTAGETESGRGGTYHSIHGSEVAFWPDIGTKRTALFSGLPDDPEILAIAESTANGSNDFKDWWDDAMAGNNDFLPFFWPWWKQREYTRDFANEAERQDFKLNVGEGPFGEDEPRLVDPGPLDTETNEHVPLALEQLHWRRKTIANKLGGRVDKFKQEYPSSDSEAFLATGHRTFDPFMVQKVIQDCEHTDPRVSSPEHPGPRKGRFRAGNRISRPARVGTIDIPEDPLWTPRASLEIGEAANWRIWLPDDDFQSKRSEKDYVAFCDPSGGQLNETDEPDYHAIQIIDHHTKAQVAAYRSRIDPDLLAEELYMACLFFGKAWVAVEVTGGFGLPIVRRLRHDYRYPFVYFRHAVDRANPEKQEDRLGWSTDRRTKPIMVAGMQEMLREGTHGIRDRVTAAEMQTYVRDDKGATGAEGGKYDDALESYMGVQQVARELPVKLKSKGKRRPQHVPRDKVTGY